MNLRKLSDRSNRHTSSRAAGDFPLDSAKQREMDFKAELQKLKREKSLEKAKVMKLKEQAMKNGKFM